MKLCQSTPDGCCTVRFVMDLPACRGGCVQEPRHACSGAYRCATPSCRRLLRAGTTACMIRGVHVCHTIMQTLVACRNQGKALSVSQRQPESKRRTCTTKKTAAHAIVAPGTRRWHAHTFKVLCRHRWDGFTVLVRAPWLPHEGWDVDNAARRHRVLHLRLFKPVLQFQRI